MILKQDLSLGQVYTSYIVGFNMVVSLSFTLLWDRYKLLGIMFPWDWVVCACDCVCMGQLDRGRGRETKNSDSGLLIGSFKKEMGTDICWVFPLCPAFYIRYFSGSLQELHFTYNEPGAEGG